jgi:phage shock protein C
MCRPWTRGRGLGDSPLPIRSRLTQNRNMAELRRPLNGRLIGGVCAALADRFGWNVSLVRLLAVLSILIPGPQVVFYVIAWVLIPAESMSAGSSPAHPTA